VALLLALGVAAIYGQTRSHGFLDFDDDLYITANPLLAAGPSWHAVAGAFSVRAANWHPLTWYSHMLDAALFGSWAGGHHLVSAALHAANAVLLCALLARMTGAFWRSAAVAALFALHPLRVESVAWAAERKDVLSALFWFLTVGAYLRHVRRPGRGRLLVVAALFALGLAAKPMLVTLPFALLLLDWWPLGRARLPGGSPFPGRRPAGAPLVREKIPLFALSLAASIVTFRAQTSTIVAEVEPAWGTRLANAVVSYAAYLWSFAWPERLAPLYPYPRAGVPGAQLAGAAVLLTVLTVAAALRARKSPWLPVGWLWYLGTLVPVIGLVQLGPQARSDRYTYLALIGVALALVWALGALWPRRAAARGALAGAFCALLVALSWSAWRYTGFWRDDLTLMSYTAGATRGNYIVLNNLGTALEEQGRFEEALRALEEAVRIKPDHCNGQYNLGTALLRMRRLPEAYGPLAIALACYEREGNREDFVADTHQNLGTVLLQTGRPAEAERHFRAALAVAPYPAAQAGLRAAIELQEAAGRVRAP
jgi:tetratricopeptide (TPR) repeat protein